MRGDGACAHIQAIKTVKHPVKRECAECVKIGAQWVHLRVCQQCGATLCCDDSPNRHATAHANSDGHPLIRSLEPGEDWSWCYVDEIAMRIPEVKGETQIPRSPLM